MPPVARPTRRPGGPGAAVRPGRALLAASLALISMAAACSSGDGGPGATPDGPDETAGGAPARPILEARDDEPPAVVPTPRSLRWIGPDVAVGDAATLDVDPSVDEATRALLVEVLEEAGATDVTTVEGAASSGEAAGAPLTVRIGPVGAGPVADDLRAAGVEPPPDLPAEGYALAAFTRDDGTATVVIGAADPAGAYYGAQTLRQITREGSILGLGIVDHPAMELRGTVEGFYGSPWTHAERLDQLRLYGRLKFNTYVYAPKDDPFHRDRWREPYPADDLARLRELVEVATAHHVRFTFAVSPGVSICFSDPADTDALVAKLAALYDIGVRAFSIALDDIDHTRWHCDADADRYGAPTTEAAANAQVDLLNSLVTGFVAEHPGVHPLQTVPTEYRGTSDSPYLRVLRERLDPSVEVMWTGTMVVPAEITVAQAGSAAEVLGRPPFVWDNTPVNDFPATEGRLLLGPYTRREPGLSDHVGGIVLNPMNQAAASKVALVGGADFAWNDAAYDPARAHRAAATMLAGGDAATTEALLAFFDVETLAPTSATDGTLSQPQAPALSRELDRFRSAWSSGDRAGAVAGLRPYAERLAGAPDVIRAGVADQAFLDDCAPWLDATALWGRALVTTLDALDARSAGDGDAAADLAATSDALVAEAGAIQTVPGETFQQGPVRVADGVLDEFLVEADELR